MMSSPLTTSSSTTSDSTHAASRTRSRHSRADAKVDSYLHVLCQVGDVLLVVELDVCVGLPLMVDAGVDGAVGSRADHGDPCRLAGQCIYIWSLDYARISNGT